MTEANDTINPQIVEERTSDYAQLPDTVQYTVGGLTKREHFAAIALSGIIANPTYSKISIEANAASAVKVADLLIDALNENKS